MGILLQVQSGHKQFGARVLFEGASMAVESSEHIGVIGPNGAGKSTLFKILVGKESLDGGEVTKSKSLRIGYLEQEEVLVDKELAAEYITRTSGKPIWELYQLAFGLGLSETHLQTPIKELSGGFRMRCQLLAQLAKEPQLLLLDEPTNYLDLESLLVLEEFLQSFSGAFLLISHDREFLRRVTDHTLEIEAGSFTKFNGHIDDYFEQKAMLEEQLKARALAVESRRKEILDFVRRFGAKATKAKQAQSRLKTLNKLEKVEISPLPMQARIRIPAPDPHR
jgi:ATP-binding cassette subfamily F protein 3